MTLVGFEAIATTPSRLVVARMQGAHTGSDRGLAR